MRIILLYAISLFSLSVYSFSLIDPNLTFFQTSWWEIFRDKMVYFGYYQRDFSWLVYLILIVLLFAFHYYLLKKYKQFNPIKIAIIIGLIFLFSYPFLSHDFFNYMFDAKIATYYHKNPYFYKALDFPNDQWLRFMHWTHRTYPYGPTFLLLTLIPSFLSFGKFVLSFIFFKSMFVLFYLATVYFLQRLNKLWAIFFATNPLIIIEGLVSSHNDLVAVSLAIFGIYYCAKNKNLIGRLLFLFSGGIKFITFPLLLWTRSYPKLHRFIFLVIIGILVYLSLKSEIQPWYFLNLFIFLPFFYRWINRLNIFFFGLLISYYPFIRLGAWDSPYKINLKHIIIIIFGLINIFYFLFSKFNDRKASQKN